MFHTWSIRDGFGSGNRPKSESNIVKNHPWLGMVEIYHPWKWWNWGCFIIVLPTLPSGKQTHKYGTSPCSIGKSVFLWPCSKAMWVIARRYTFRMAMFRGNIMIQSSIAIGRILFSDKPISLLTLKCRYLAIFTVMALYQL